MQIFILKEETGNDFLFVWQIRANLAPATEKRAGLSPVFLLQNPPESTAGSLTGSDTNWLHRAQGRIKGITSFLNFTKKCLSPLISSTLRWSRSKTSDRHPQKTEFILWFTCQCESFKGLVTTVSNPPEITWIEQHRRSALHSCCPKRCAHGELIYPRTAFVVSCTGWLWFESSIRDE